MKKTEKIELSLNNAFRIFEQSFNRVKYFTCISENISKDFMPSDWIIRHESGLHVQFPNPGEKDLFNIIDGYKNFMRRYLVRDCIESYSLSLDRFFELMLLDGKRISSDQVIIDALDDTERKRLKKFHRKGLEDKTEIIKNDFKIELSDQHNEIIKSLKSIRNCLSHSNGFVRDEDGEKVENNTRKFLWKTMKIYGTGEHSGNEIEFKNLVGTRTTEPISIYLKINTHEKYLKSGDCLSFSSSELYDIAFTLQLTAHHLLQVASQNLLETAH